MTCRSYVVEAVSTLKIYKIVMLLKIVWGLNKKCVVCYLWATKLCVQLSRKFQKRKNSFPLNFMYYYVM